MRNQPLKQRPQLGGTSYRLNDYEENVICASGWGMLVKSGCLKDYLITFMDLKHLCLQNITCSTLCLCKAMIKIAGTKSNNKINFKEFVDFFYKVD